MSQPEKHERNFLEASGELFEAAADLITESELVKAIPVFGTAVKLCKGIDDVRSRMLLKKIMLFLNEPKLHAADKAKLRDKLLEDANEAESVGAMMLMVLDKATDLTKPSLLAKVLVAFLDGVITREAVLSLTHMIDSSFILDLKKFVEHDGFEVKDGTMWADRLVASGLFFVQVQSTFGGANVNHTRTPLGDTFLNVVRYGTSKQRY